MTSSKYYSFVNVLLFYILLQENILFNNAEENCLNPSFQKDQKVVVEYFFNHEAIDIYNEICDIVFKSNELISVNCRMCNDLKDKDTCIQHENCIYDRLYACYYKIYTDIYNDCSAELPTKDPAPADCICAGSADDILTSNEDLRKKYGIQTLPAVVLNEKYDPCFKDYSFESMKTYFCKAYNNELPLCK